MSLKPLEWIGSSKKDLDALSKEVSSFIGFALFKAQEGKQHKSTKVLKGFGNANIIEIKTNDRAGTYRAVYTVRFAQAIFVLHVFQKKSKHGIETPKQDIELIKNRLKLAEIKYQEIYIIRK